MSFRKSTSVFKGIRFRLTFVYSTLFGLFICVFAYVLLKQNLQFARQTFDSALFNFAIDISAQIEKTDFPLEKNFRIPKRELEKEFPFTLQETYYIVKSLNGEELLRGGNEIHRVRDIPYSSELAHEEDYTHRFLDLTEDGEEYRAVNMKVTSANERVMILQVLTPTSLLHEESERDLAVILFLIPTLILVSSILSYILAGNALIPIRELIKTTQSIAATNLSQRVPEPETGDEISELASTFNTLLGRLEKSWKAQENFVANASHQLNTPLAIIKGELDVLESKERSLEEHEKFRKSLREELLRLTALVQQMLLISRVEAGLESFNLRPVRIDEVLLSVTSRLTNRAREKKITIRFNMEEFEEDLLEIMGERQLLECLFENLVENAIKYSPRETVLSIGIKGNNNSLIVEIQDEGDGMEPEDFLKIIHSRFQRASQIMPGTGIGLSIANQISEFHRAELIYNRLSSGSLFQVKFPKKSI